jgi:hypothetical protein
MYIWTKRQFVGEMERLVDAGGAVLIGHTHNERTWSPSHGQPLSPHFALEITAYLDDEGARHPGDARNFRLQ